MKPAFLALLSLLSPVALGQGTIRFSNIGDGLDAPIYNAAGTLVPTNFFEQAPGICGVYYAQLSVGDGPATIDHAATVRFSQPGYFGTEQGTLALPFPPGSHPWFAVHVFLWVDYCTTTWQVPGEFLEVGSSGVFQLEPNGPGLGDGTPTAPPPPLHGLKSMQLQSYVDASLPWVIGPAIVEDDIRMWWEGPTTVLRQTFLQKAPAPDGPWTTLTNAQSPHIEPYVAGSTAFFRAVTIRQAVEAPR